MLSRFLPRRRLFLFCAALLLALAGSAAWCYVTLPDVSFLQNRKTTLTIQVRDWQGREHPFLLGPRNHDWTPLAAIPAALQWAVIVGEDDSFYTNHGIDVPAMEEALKYDLEHGRLARGGSTITQQLAKNLFLSRRKNLLRKAEELILARRLEAKLSKKRILELYLNAVELGPMVYGVGEGARYHFHQPVAELNPAQSAFLAAMLPGPRLAYNPALRPRRVRRRAAHLLQLMERRGVLDAEGYTAALDDLDGGELSARAGMAEGLEGADRLGPAVGMGAVLPEEGVAAVGNRMPDCTGPEEEGG